MSEGQYTAYSDTFDIPKIVHPIYGKEVRVIGGVTKEIGEDYIKISLCKMGIIIN